MTAHRSNPKAISTRSLAEMSDRWRPPHRLVGLVGGRWTLAVLAELAGHGRRYQDLHDSLEGISHKVLTDTLRRAERDGLVTRKVHAVVPPRVEYSLTPMGRTLLATIDQLIAWADAHLAAIDAARAAFDARIAQADGDAVVADPASDAYTVGA